MTDRERLAGLLGQPVLSWLLERLRRRLERGEELAGTVRLRRPTPDQRRAADRLLGRPPSTGRSLGVPLELLAQRLRNGGLCDDLRQAVEALCGPVENRQARREQARRRWRQLLDRAAGHDPRPELRAWWRSPETRRLLRRLSSGDPDRGAALVEDLLRLTDRLPAEDITLQELATAASGDSHALDPGRPLASLAIRAAAGLAGLEPAAGAAARRQLWQAVGVLESDLGASVLLLGLGGAGRSLSDRVLGLHAAAGEPCRLSAGQLVRHPPSIDATARWVHVCENPAVLAAAAQRLGAAAAPIVATEGRPTAAVHLLLGRLVAAGARLRYHGDFDWPGLAIAGPIIERYGAEPWRFRRADYRAAAGRLPLAGSPVPSPWDPPLATEMERLGVAVHEEQVLDQLLADLAP